MYEGACTPVRTIVGLTEEFEEGVGLHQGLSLSPYLLNIVMDVITEGVREHAPWSMLFGDDIILCDEANKGLERKLERWRDELEDRGLNQQNKNRVYVL